MGVVGEKWSHLRKHPNHFSRLKEYQYKHRVCTTVGTCGEESRGYCVFDRRRAPRVTVAFVLPKEYMLRSMQGTAGRIVEHKALHTPPNHHFCTFPETRLFLREKVVPFSLDLGFPV